VEQDLLSAVTCISNRDITEEM